MKFIYLIGLLTISSAMFAANSSKHSSSSEQGEEDMVEVEGHLPFSKPAWEFLQHIKQNFANDGGTLKMKIVSHRQAGRLAIFIKAPRNRQDLAQFTMDALQNNFELFQMHLPSVLINRALQLYNRHGSQDVIFVYNRRTQTLDLAGFLEHFTNLIEELQRMVAEDMLIMSDDLQ